MVRTYPVEGSAAIYAVWLVQELAWWWLVTILLAIQFVFIADAPVWREIRQLARALGVRPGRNAASLTIKQAE